MSSAPGESDGLVLDERRERGRQIAASGGLVHMIDDLNYAVDSPDRRYELLNTSHGPVCSCPDHMEGGNRCEHMWAASIAYADGMRAGRGRLIAEAGNQIHRVDELTCLVDSQNSGEQYVVSRLGDRYTCTCPDYELRKSDCKHVYAVEFRYALRRAAEERRTELRAAAAGACPECGSKNAKKGGVRHNKNRDVQMYVCRDCGRKFSGEPGFGKMHASPEVITKVMQLFFSGSSHRGIRDFLRLENVRFSHVSVGNWIDKYVALTESLVRFMKPMVGERRHADEVIISVRGREKCVFFLMDNATRFILAQEVAASKNSHNARGLLRAGIEKSGKVPLAFVSDGLPAYKNAHKAEHAPKVPQDKESTHISDTHIRNEFDNNNIQERLNGEYRHREKTLRGIQKEDSAFIRGFPIHHNYVRSHEGLDGKTPADLAGIDIEGPDKWKVIIHNAALLAIEEARRARAKNPKAPRRRRAGSAKNPGRGARAGDPKGSGAKP